MRRRDWLGSTAGASLWLAGCAGSTPPTRWYELRNDLPTGVVAPPSAPGDGSVWEVSNDLGLPGALDRDTLMLASGAATLLPLAGHRWSEPLRDSIPRLLVRDLGSLRGPGLVWAAPAPADVPVARRLRVELSMLQAGNDRRTLRLQARWWLVDSRFRPAAVRTSEAARAAPPAGPDPAPTRAGNVDLEVAVGGGSVDALAGAHRLALWQLAERIAGTP